MTATEELRRLLDKRGVEWWQSVNMLGCVFTRWYSPLFSDEVVAMENGDGELELFSHLMTPEQAIAATLGESPRLPHFWTHDGALHVELPKLPDSISVRLPDQRDREVSSARTWQYTRDDADATPTRQGDAGTCKLDDFADVPFSVDYEVEGYDMDSGRDYATLAECSACGAYVIVPPSYHHVLTCDGDEVYRPYRFCPNCGRRIVEPTTNDVDAEVDDG